MPIIDPLTPQFKWNAPFELINSLHKFVRNLKYTSIAAKSQYTTYCELALEFEIEHNLTVQTNANPDKHPHVKAVNMYSLIFRLFDICDTVLPKELAFCLTDNLTKYGMDKCKHTTSAYFMLKHSERITQTLYEFKNGNYGNKPVFSRLQTPLTQQDYCTIGNKIRIKLNLSPTLHTAKFDRLREEKIKNHNETSIHKHIIQLVIPENIPPDEISESQFNAWWGGTIRVRCNRCDSQKSLAYLKKFMSETCNHQNEETQATDHSITNQYRTLLELKPCNMQTYFDKKRRIAINKNNDDDNKHQIIITPPTQLESHLTLTVPPKQISLIPFYSCIKCLKTFNNNNIIHACKLSCGGLSV